MRSTVVFSMGDKILNAMKNMEMSIPGLAVVSGVGENALMDILAGIREADIGTLCKIVDVMGICVRD